MRIEKLEIAKLLWLDYQGSRELTPQDCRCFLCLSILCNDREASQEPAWIGFLQMFTVLGELKGINQLWRRQLASTRTQCSSESGGKLRPGTDPTFTLELSCMCFGFLPSHAQGPQVGLTDNIELLSDSPNRLSLLFVCFWGDLSALFWNTQATC